MLQINRKKTFLLWLFILFFNVCHAENKNISLDLQGVKLPDALQVMAKFMNQSLIISPAVAGEVSLHLHDASPADAFELLLTSQGLDKWQVGQVWYVAPRTEWVNRTQDAIKLQEVRDEATQLAISVWQVRYAKAEDIARLIQDSNYSLLSKRGNVRVDSRTNIICIQDLPARIPQIQKLIEQLDVPVQQVLIKTRLVNVDHDFERQLGIHFDVSGASSSDAISGTNGPFSLAVATLADGSLLDVRLAAMENEGKGELISSPSLFTANQQAASIESGEEIPYQEVSRSGGTGIAFKKAVMSLKVTPQVMPGNKILLQLQVNQDRPSNRIVLGVPAITTRQMTTNILVKNGRTVVLGGIYELNTEESEQRIPFLGKVPVVGWLFRQKNSKENKRELLIFVTPKVVSVESEQ
jgi:type IV pilus assembly protein PilQ